MTQISNLIKLLNLQPLDPEGGYFCRTYTSADQLPSRRPIGTMIYYLVTKESWSQIHRVDADEIFHFYAGGTVELFEIHKDGSSTLSKLGTQFEDNERPQHIVPKGTWQGLRLHPESKTDWCLLGTTCCPGFEWGGFELADAAELKSQFPKLAEQISRFMKSK